MKRAELEQLTPGTEVALGDPNEIYSSPQKAILVGVCCVDEDDYYAVAQRSTWYKDQEKRDAAYGRAFRGRTPDHIVAVEDWQSGEWRPKIVRSRAVLRTWVEQEALDAEERQRKQAHENAAQKVHRVNLALRDRVVEALGATPQERGNYYDFLTRYETANGTEIDFCVHSRNLTRDVEVKTGIFTVKFRMPNGPELEDVIAKLKVMVA